jgi:predicted Ser/Thr protein kinase
MKDIETAASELGGLRLPPDLQPLEVVGEGRHSITFRVKFRGDILAMKVYRPESINRFRKKHDVNIAVFEMSRNRAFRKIPELLPFTAKPISVLGHDGRCSLMFLQEFVDGIPLTELAEKNKGLPDSVLEDGEIIVRHAEMNGYHELDLHYKDVLVRNQAGVWHPVLHDFNKMTKTEPQPDSLLTKVFKTGKDKKSRRDHKHLAEWRDFSQKCSR